MLRNTSKARIASPLAALGLLAFAVSLWAGCKTNAISDDHSTRTTIGQLCVGGAENAGQCSGSVCVLGYCRQECTTSADCTAGSICLAGDDDARGCRLPAEATCDAAKPCTQGLVCASDSTCRNGCDASGACKVPSNTCHDGTCSSSNEPLGTDGGTPAKDAGDVVDPNCGKLDQACCASPAGACATGGSCAGQVCSCFERFVGRSGGLLSAEGKLTVLGEASTLLVDDAAMPFLAKVVVGGERSTDGWQGTAMRSDGTVWGFGFWSGTSTAADQVAAAPARVLDSNGNPLPPATRLGDILIYSPTPPTRSAIVNGRVYRWGSIRGNQENRAKPLIANANGDPLTDVVAYTGSNMGGYALLSDGTVLAHGYNTYGQLGIGHVSDEELYPVPVAALTGQGVTRLVGAYSGWTTCAILASKEVSCWGHNDGGALGVGTSSGSTLQPGAHVMIAAATPLDNVVDIVDAAPYTNFGFCALRGTDGSVWCWGQGMALVGDAPYAGRVTISDGSPLTEITKIGYSAGNQGIAMDAHGRFWQGPFKVGAASAALMATQPTCP